MEISCSVFLPFSGRFTFVYEAVAKVSEIIHHEAKINLIFSRADDEYTADSEKINHIKELIKGCDIAIFDITSFRPNVCWELGLAEGLEKDIIIIYDKTYEKEVLRTKEKFPLNLSGRQRINYKFSTEGLEQLESNLQKKIKSFIPKIIYKKESLYKDKIVETYLVNIKNNLKNIKRDSLLKNLAVGEFERLGKRIASLQSGQFDLRNRKPATEVIYYYSLYLSQLDNEDCKFLTITHLNFWSFITRNGRDWLYFDRNIEAVKKGTNLRRIFKIPLNDQGEIFFKNENEKIFVKELLKKHLKETQNNNKFKGSLEVKLVFVEENTPIQKLGNMALWYKKNQRMMFKPSYELKEEDHPLKETIFTYWEDLEGKTEITEIQREFNSSESDFNELWEENDLLNDEILGKI